MANKFALSAEQKSERLTQPFSSSDLSSAGDRVYDFLKTAPPLGTDPTFDSLFTSKKPRPPFSKGSLDEPPSPVVIDRKLSMRIQEHQARMDELEREFFAIESDAPQQRPSSKPGPKAPSESGKHSAAPPKHADAASPPAQSSPPVGLPPASPSSNSTRYCGRQCRCVVQ